MTEKFNLSRALKAETDTSMIHTITPSQRNHGYIIASSYCLLIASQIEVEVSPVLLLVDTETLLCRSEQS